MAQNLQLHADWSIARLMRVKLETLRARCLREIKIKTSLCPTQLLRPPVLCRWARKPDRPAEPQRGFSPGVYLGNVRLCFCGLLFFFGGVAEKELLICRVPISTHKPIQILFACFRNQSRSSLLTSFSDSGSARPLAHWARHRSALLAARITYHNLIYVLLLQGRS